VRLLAHLSGGQKSRKRRSGGSVPVARSLGFPTNRFQLIGHFVHPFPIHALPQLRE
jgi:hypothetical protein